MAQTHKSLRAQIARALDSCQSRARTRLLTVDNVMDAILHRPEAATKMTIHAGSVPLRYRHAAMSTQVIVTQHPHRSYTVCAWRVPAGRIGYGRGIVTMYSVHP